MALKSSIRNSTVKADMDKQCLFVCWLVGLLPFVCCLFVCLFYEMGTLHDSDCSFQGLQRTILPMVWLATDRSKSFHFPFHQMNKAEMPWSVHVQVVIRGYSKVLAFLPYQTADRLERLLCFLVHLPVHTL